MRHTILITGASRGIGREIALTFANNNSHLILTCEKNTDLLLATAAQCEEKGAVCECFTGSLADYNTVSNGLFALIRNKKLIPDIVINNAGISYIGLLQLMTPEEWHAVIDANLSSVFYCCRESIPYMLQAGHGKIINISSIWGVQGASCEAAYSASKGGVNAFTKALAKELAPSNIQVNAIAFGVIDTDMNQHLNEEERTVLASDIPMGRFASPKEAAEFVYHIATAGTYLTGQVIGFDGAY